MSDRPDISVVLIVHNGENFIDEAIRSVADQTCDGWELLVVDDGSTDGTALLVSAWSESLGSQLRILRHAGGVNRGMSASRNLGIRSARADVIAFLDHDDVFLPRHLQSALSTLQQTEGASAVVSPVIRWRSWCGGADEVQDLGAPSGRLLDPPGTLPVFLSRTDAAPLGSVVRRATLMSIGLYEESFRGMYEDQVMLAKLMLRHPIVIGRAATYRYRQHADSCVSQAFRSGVRLPARRRYLKWLLAHMKTLDIECCGLREQVQTEVRKTRGARLKWLRRAFERRVARLIGRAG